MVLNLRRKGILFYVSYQGLSWLIFRPVSDLKYDVLSWVTCPENSKSFKLQFHLLLRWYKDVATSERGYLRVDVLSFSRVLNLEPLSFSRKVNTGASAIRQVS